MDIKIIVDSFYGTIDPRRRKEVADYRMIQEDRHAPANLPREGFQREFRSQRMGRKTFFFDEIG